MTIFTVFKKLSVATVVGTALMVGATATTQAATINGINQEQTSSNQVKSFALVKAIAPQAPSAQMTRVAAAIAPPTSNLTLDGPWYQFSFSQVGVPALGCAPADPSGLDCDPGSAKNSVFADAPAWKFLAPEAGAILKVTDAFFPGDVFNVFDFGNLIGSTSAANDGDSCGDNPDTCFADPLLSKGVFNLASGTHSITIVPTASPFEKGSAYFRIDSAAAKSVPEPTSILGVLAVLGSAGVLKRRKADF